MKLKYELKYHFNSEFDDVQNIIEYKKEFKL